MVKECSKKTDMVGPGITLSLASFQLSPFVTSLKKEAKNKVETLSSKFRKMGSTVSYARSHQTRLAAVEIGKSLFSVTPENLKRCFLKILKTGFSKFQKHNFQIRMLPP
jgi:hypothetical protein